MEAQQFFVGYTGAPDTLDFAAPIVDIHTPEGLNFRIPVWDKNAVMKQWVYMDDQSIVGSKFYNTANAVPPAGSWMVVKVLGSVTQALVRGGVAFWDGTEASRKAGIVTPTYSAGAIPVGLFTVSRTATNQDIATTIRPFNRNGMGYGKFVASLTNGSPSVGDLIFVADGGSGLGALDVIADATALTSANLRNIVGQVSESLPANSSVTLISLSQPLQNGFM